MVFQPPSFRRNALRARIKPQPSIKLLCLVPREVAAARCFGMSGTGGLVRKAQPLTSLACVAEIQRRLAFRLQTLPSRQRHLSAAMSSHILTRLLRMISTVSFRPPDQRLPCEHLGSMLLYDMGLRCSFLLQTSFSCSRVWWNKRRFGNGPGVIVANGRDEPAHQQCWAISVQMPRAGSVLTMKRTRKRSRRTESLGS